MAGIKLQLLQLDKISEEREKILSRQEELARYISDISSLYEALHAGSITVSSEVSHRYLDILLQHLPDTRSGISRYVKVEVIPYLSPLIRHHSKSEVMTLRAGSEEGVVTVALPYLADVVLVEVRASVVYKCPLLIHAILPDDKKYFEFVVYCKTLAPAPSTNPHSTPCYSTRPIPSILEQYLKSRDTARDCYTLTLHYTSDCIPGDLQPGEVKQNGEYEISNLCRAELLDTVVKLRKNGVLLRKDGGNGRNEISLSSSLETLLGVYQKVRGIS